MLHDDLAIKSIRFDDELIEEAHQADDSDDAYVRLEADFLLMAQALGETAPLLLIGMVAFIVDVPDGFFDSATVLPVQVFLWAGSPELAFIERASAAIMVLLTFLIGMNALAIWLRKRLERRW